MKNDNNTFLGNFRSGIFSRAIAVVTLTFFTWTFCLADTATAVKDQMGEKVRQQAKIDAMYEKTPEEKLSYRLSKLQDEVTQTIPNDINNRAKNENWLDKTLNYVGLGNDLLTSDEVNQLTTLKQSIAEAATIIDESFNQVEKHLKDKNQPKEIMDRQAQAKAKVKSEYQKLQTTLDQLLNAKGRSNQQQAFNQLKDQLQKSQFKKGFTPTDPNNLPFGVQKPTKQEPRLDQQALYDLTHEPVQVAGDITPDVLATALNIAQPTQADLAETIDTTQTQAIKDLATQLNHDPVKIYTWVHNNIRFVPSYGSIQGADMTLQTLKGNAMDTASLLIALLRASNIPARYAYGTVETTKERVMNWVGGVNVPEAATNLMQQGGIPTALVSVNGIPAKIRFEQTWVEAWVDFEPSRGMKHDVQGCTNAAGAGCAGAAGDTWIPMDASFKQYEFTQPTVNIQQAVPFDAQGLANTIQQNTTVNTTEGWVQGVPQQQIQDAIVQYDSQIQSYLESQDLSDAKEANFLGAQTIKIKAPQPLSSGLPYQLLSKPTKFAEVADNQRLKFKYELYTSNYGTKGSELLRIEEPTVKLAGKKLALSFKPATQVDENLINSYLPTPNAEGEIDPNQLPTGLAGYLIHLVPEFTLDNELKTTSTITQTMGQELISEMGYYFPQNQQWETTQNLPVAGQYEAIALNLQGIGNTQAIALNNSLDNAREKLIGSYSSEEINKHNTIGDILYANIINYFLINNKLDEVNSNSVGMISYLSASYGLFQTNLQTEYWFGLPKNTNFNGFKMDVDRYFLQTIDKANDNLRVKKYHEAIGMRLSEMEAVVPEQMLSNDTNQVNAISATKAIRIAAQEGQRIYKITENNLMQALSNINFSKNIEDEIINLVTSGKSVTTHQNPINFFGKSELGYIVLDPHTGAGAYIISGGESGGDVVSGNKAEDAIDGLITVIEYILGEVKNAVANAISKLIQAFQVGLNVGKILYGCAAENILFSLKLLFAAMFWAVGVDLLVAWLLGLVLSPFLAGLAGAMAAAFFMAWAFKIIYEHCVLDESARPE